MEGVLVTRFGALTVAFCLATTNAFRAVAWKTANLE